MSRPSTLLEAVERIQSGVPYSIAIPEFLDNFYTCPERAEMMLDEPPISGDSRLNAMVAALCEYLTKRYELPFMPDWVSGPARFLSEPWFTTSSNADGMREFLTISTPAEFLRHNIFTESEPLRRASQQLMTRSNR